MVCSNSGIYKIHPTATKKTSRPLAHNDTPLLQRGALPIKGVIVPVGTKPPVPIVPIVPIPDEPGKMVLLAGMAGRGIGFTLGVIVVEPTIISGAPTETGVTVEDPLNVAVKVVKTSVKVVVRRGSFDLGDGLVVAARVVDIAASAMPEKVVVSVAVTFWT